MEISWLKYFVVLAEDNHMTIAAKKLGISQPALSMAIKRLEGELGVKLFDRVGRNLVLNEYGKLFLRYATRILADLQSAYEAISEKKGVMERHITIATTGTTFLFGMLRDFLKTHKGISIKQSIVSPDKALAMLRSLEVDFAITSPPLDDEDIETVEIYEDRVFLAVSKNHYLAYRDTIDLRELKDEDFIELVESYSFRKLTDEMCLLAGFVPNIVFEGEIMLMAELVEEGLGVALVPESVMKLYPDFPVKVIPVVYPVYTRKVGLSWYKHAYMNVAKDMFRKFVIGYLP